MDIINFVEYNPISFKYCRNVQWAEIWWFYIWWELCNWLDEIIAAMTCQPLVKPANGTINPISCTNGGAFPHQRCYFSCDPGFRVLGNPVRSCAPSLRWSPSRPPPVCNKGNIILLIYLINFIYSWCYSLDRNTIIMMWSTSNRIVKLYLIPFCWSCWYLMNWLKLMFSKLLYKHLLVDLCTGNSVPS